ncbi:MAG: DNA topoisomerase [Holdemanella porci]|uniref:DNA topoisomerase n=1 Tax=Holdemanella porci TaxID=2652276 RepID=UPI003990EE43
MKVIIAEKPNLGRTIASALGVYDKYGGYLSNGEIAVTYAFGHLLELKDMDAYFGHKVPWGENLPFYPDPFEFDLKKNVKKQFDIICNLINSSETDEIICAGDADREGEVIVRLILSAGLKSYKKITRLWLPDQTPQTIIKQMKERKLDSEYDNLYYEGLARTYIDWILGINLTRSISSIASQTMSIGRVICPIVIAIYEREKAIEKFVAQKYYSLVSNVDGVELVSKLKFDINERSDALSVCNDYNTS